MWRRPTVLNNGQWWADNANYVVGGPLHGLHVQRRVTGALRWRHFGRYRLTMHARRSLADLRGCLRALIPSRILSALKHQKLGRSSSFYYSSFTDRHYRQLYAGLIVLICWDLLWVMVYLVLLHLGLGPNWRNAWHTVHLGLA